MGLFEGRELEDEFCGIVSELGGDVEGRRKGDQYLLGTHALYHGGPASWALSPKIFDRGQVEVLRDAAETMGAIMNKVTAHYLKDAGFRTLFHLPKSLEDLTLIPSGYDCLIPLARVDVFFDEETGDYQFCELNTDGSAGMTNTVEITRAIQRTASYQRFAERHPRISTFDVVQGAIGAVLETYASWEGAGKGIHPAQGPSMALVDYAESVSADEVDDIIDRLATADYEHYEISNFAKLSDDDKALHRPSSYRSRHNSSYWHDIPYIGLGAAAHSYDGHSRHWAVADLKQYITAIEAGQLPYTEEPIDESTHYDDLITTALRTREGLDIDRLSPPYRFYLLTQAQPYLDKNMLAIIGHHLHLTRQGILLSNTIMSDLMHV